MSIQALITKYEQYLRMITSDQRTDDAMSSEAFRHTSQTYERVINDLKALLGPVVEPTPKEKVESFLRDIGIPDNEIDHCSNGAYDIIQVDNGNNQGVVHFVFRWDGTFYELTAAKSE